jgi:hypothetical protein
MASKHQFTHVLPVNRLGEQHTSLESYKNAVVATNSPLNSKEYTLVVVTEPLRRRILLGLKQRGFGKGLFNSFGGKLDPGETDGECACRELEEETGIALDNDVTMLHKVGILRYTFDDSQTEMIMNLFRLNIKTSVCERRTNDKSSSIDENFNSDSTHASSSDLVDVDPSVIRGCDEITPQWFDDWYDIPLNNMFADDSIWLTRLLSTNTIQCFNGWFHFQKGGQDVNTILHYYLTLSNDEVISVTPSSSQPSSFSLEQRLFHRLHDNQTRSPSPSIKEFKECFAFCNVVRSFLSKDAFHVVIDVAGGHGALAALFLITTSATEAIVIDPAQVGKGSVQRAWGDFYQDKALRYRHECLRSALPDELNELIIHRQVPRQRILVVACHACQHLSEETLEIACQQFGVHAAAMPCCQKDISPGSSWKALSKQIGVGVETVMDLLLAGKVMSWKAPPDDVPYEVRMKTINSQVTPQNRVILCRAGTLSFSTIRKDLVDKSHNKLGLVYQKAHENGK